MTIEDIARVCHETNRAYCLALGDYSQVAWHEAPEWQRNSAIAGVQAHLNAGPLGLDPRESHDAWYTHKVADGWVYGPVKDAVKKTHPQLVSFGDLPLEQVKKDELFGQVVATLRDLL